MYPEPTRLSNDRDENPWKGAIEDFLGRTLDTPPAEGRPPGEEWAHQRWSEFPPEVYYVTAQIDGTVDDLANLIELSPCPWDCGGDNDNNVGIVDFLALLSQWGTPGTCDFDGGGVGIVDFLKLLANWGPC